MIYDTWTGGVRYACEARLENPNDSRNPTQESITRVINAGSFPLALILERLLVLAAVWVIASKGIRYLMTADSTPEETGA
jgi:hypothetical protein